MRQIIILPPLIFQFTAQAFACDCKEIQPLDTTRVKSFEWSDLVFLGKLTEVDSTSRTYTFQILELFKGDTIHKTVTGKYHDSCSKFPTEKGRWLVYADLRDGLIDISDCLASRSESEPYCLNCLPFPPPPKSDVVRQKEEKQVAEFEERSKELWQEELEWLRRM